MIKKQKRKFDFDAFVLIGQILDSKDSLFKINDSNFLSFGDPKPIQNNSSVSDYSEDNNESSGREGSRKTFPELELSPSCPGLSASSYRYSGKIIPIGFDFCINQKIYKEIYVNLNGWCVLIDPDCSGTFNPSSIVSVDPSNNLNIEDSFQGSHVLLSVWFDSLTNSFQKPSNKFVYIPKENNTTKYTAEDLFSNPRNANEASQNSKSILEKVFKKHLNNDNLFEKIQQKDSNFQNGFSNITSKIFKNYAAGVRHYSGVDPNGELIKIIRWSSFLPIKNSQGNKIYQNIDSLMNILDFELIIFSSGEIQYRYSGQRIIDLKLDASEPKIGIFLGGKNNFKNFIEYKGLVGGKNFILSNGYLFKYFPDELNTPVNKSFLKNLGAKEIVSKECFNDQKTFIFDKEQYVEYPSMIPSNTVESNDPYVSSLGRNMSHKNGIKIKRSLSAGLMESVLEIHEAEERKTK